MASIRDTEALLEEEEEEETIAQTDHWSRIRRRPAVLATGVLAVLLIVAGAALAAGDAVALTTSSALGSRAVVGLDEEAGEDEEEEEEEDKGVFNNCLCVFDIDRTLTGKQGWKDKCSKDAELEGIPDEAYAKGTLLVSELAQSVGATFCGECYHGIVTAGIASGPNSGERKNLLKYLGGTARTRSDFWQDIKFKPHTKVVSSLVVQASDTLKQLSVESMVQWWREKQGIPLKDEDVYFFDDIKENVKPFESTGFNAKQISCSSRGPIEVAGAYDGKIGGCGGEFAEITKFKGVHTCEDP